MIVEQEGLTQIRRIIEFLCRFAVEICKKMYIWLDSGPVDNTTFCLSLTRDIIWQNVDGLHLCLNCFQN